LPPASHCAFRFPPPTANGKGDAKFPPRREEMQIYISSLLAGNAWRATAAAAPTATNNVGLLLHTGGGCDREEGDEQRKRALENLHRR
jgi:hypothetical protein